MYIIADQEIVVLFIVYAYVRIYSRLQRRNYNVITWTIILELGMVCYNMYSAFNRHLLMDLQITSYCMYTDTVMFDCTNLLLIYSCVTLMYFLTDLCTLTYVRTCMYIPMSTCLHTYVFLDSVSWRAIER